jgi:predicted lipid carrier protein YhbT
MLMAAIGDRFDAATLARMARRTPEPLLKAMTAGPFRAFTVAQVFRRMPAQIKPAAAPPDCVIRWRIGEGDKGETWYCVFESGRLRTTRNEPETAPRTTLDMSARDFLRIATGKEIPMAMFQEGRIEISGDLLFAAQMQGMFTIPK